MSICQDFEFFEAGPALQKEIFSLWRNVFCSWSDETAAIIEDRLDSGFKSGTVRLTAVREKSGGRIAAALRLEYTDFAGDAPGVIQTGIHVGEVAVLPAYQGRGLGTFLMGNTMALLKADPRGAEFAFLGGYTGFYRRFGFSPVDGNTTLEVKLTPERGGNRRLPVVERLETFADGTFRTFLPGEDQQKMQALQPWIAGQRIFTDGIFKREFLLRKSCFELDCLVLSVKDDLRGYMFRCGNVLYHFSLSDAGAAEMLMQEMLRRIADEGNDTAVISCNLAFAENWLRQKQLPFRKITGVGGLASQMRASLI